MEPTVFADVDNKMRIAQEEIFGPVLAVIPYEDTADAVASPTTATTACRARCGPPTWTPALDIARQVRTGTYTVNGFAMEWGAPFGGFKNSGVGRELGPEGLGEFLEYKTINLPDGTDPTLKY